MATIELTMRHTRHEGAGLSSDTKPSANYDDRIYETDTGDEYKCFGGDNWVKISTGGAAHTMDASGANTPIGYEQETSLSSAVALSGGSLPAGATYALIQAESQNVRWRDDGTSPTASVGHRLLAGESKIFYNLSALKFIEEAASAKLNVTYY